MLHIFVSALWFGKPGSQGAILHVLSRGAPARWAGPHVRCLSGLSTENLPLEAPQRFPGSRGLAQERSVHLSPRPTPAEPSWPPRPLGFPTFSAKGLLSPPSPLQVMARKSPTYLCGKDVPHGFSMKT